MRLLWLLLLLLLPDGRAPRGLAARERRVAPRPGCHVRVEGVGGGGGDSPLIKELLVLLQAPSQDVGERIQRLLDLRELVLHRRHALVQDILTPAHVGHQLVHGVLCLRMERAGYGGASRSRTRDWQWYALNRESKEIVCTGYGSLVL